MEDFVKQALENPEVKKAVTSIVGEDAVAEVTSKKKSAKAEAMSKVMGLVSKLMMDKKLAIKVGIGVGWIVLSGLIANIYGLVQLIKMIF